MKHHLSALKRAGLLGTMLPVRMMYPLYERKYSYVGLREDDVVWVDPRRIAAHMADGIPGRLQALTGRKHAAIVGGRWDLHVPRVEFTAKPVYTACYQRWQEGYAWEDTELIQEYVYKLSNGIPCRFRNSVSFSKHARTPRTV